jgi:hypothetical protein
MEKTSLRKLNANRRNALQSTGPRTPHGKRISRWNSLRHGLLARDVVIQDGPAREREEDFLKLLAALRNDLEPMGSLEEILVENIAVCYWRLRRVLQAENGEIRSGLDGSARSFYWSLAMQAALARESGHEQPSTIRSNSYGVQFLIGLLDEMKAEVEANKRLSKSSLRKIATYFGDGQDSIAALCATALASPDLSASSTQRPETGSTLEADARLLAILDHEKNQLEMSLASVSEKEISRVDAFQDSLSLPRDPDRILRYEVAIERQMYRALRQLERIQHRRQTAPPSQSPVKGEAPAKTDFCETNPT